MVVDRSAADHVPPSRSTWLTRPAAATPSPAPWPPIFAVKYDPREAVKFASAAGALVCTKFGVIEALPTKAEIIQLLQREDIDLLPGTE